MYITKLNKFGSFTIYLFMHQLSTECLYMLGSVVGPEDTVLNKIENSSSSCGSYSLELFSHHLLNNQFSSK